MSKGAKERALPFDSKRPSAEAEVVCIRGAAEAEGHDGVCNEEGATRPLGTPMKLDEPALLADPLDSEAQAEECFPSLTSATAVEMTVGRAAEASEGSPSDVSELEGCSGTVLSGGDDEDGTPSILDTCCSFSFLTSAGGERRAGSDDEAGSRPGDELAIAFGVESSSSALNAGTHSAVLAVAVASNAGVVAGVACRSRMYRDWGWKSSDCLALGVQPKDETR